MRNGIAVTRWGSMLAGMAAAAACSAITGLDDFELTSGAGSGGAGNAGSTASAGGDTGAGGGSASSSSGTGAGGAPTCAGDTWAVRVGECNDDFHPPRVAMGVDDRVVVATGFRGMSNLGLGDLVAHGQEDVLLAAFDATGAPLWNNRFLLTGAAYSTGLALDGAGAVLLTGILDGAIDFGGGALDTGGAQAAFFAKLDANGGHLWSNKLQPAQGTSIAPHPDGGALVAGILTGNATFAGQLLPYGGGNDVLVLKLQDNGAAEWAFTAGSAGSQRAHSVAADIGGDVYVAGTFNDTIDFDTQLAANGDDAYLLKLTALGVPEWSVQFTGNSSQEGRALAVDSAGNVVVAGVFREQIVINGMLMNGHGCCNNDIFIAKYDAQGTHLWSAVYGENDIQEVNALFIDKNDRIYMTGHFRGPFDFGGVLLFGQKEDVFVAALSPTGEPLFAQGFGDSQGGDRGFGVAANACGDIALSGVYERTIDFGSGPLPDGNGHQTFLARLPIALPLP